MFLDAGLGLMDLKTVLFLFWKIITNVEFFVAVSFFTLWIFLLYCDGRLERYSRKSLERIIRFLQWYVLGALGWAVFIITKKGYSAMLPVAIGTVLGYLVKKMLRLKKTPATGKPAPVKPENGE